MKAIGIDAGTEYIKVAVIEQHNNHLVNTDRFRVEHFKKPKECLNEILGSIAMSDDYFVAVTGKYSRLLPYVRIPVRDSLAKGFRYFFNSLESAAIISISSQGYSILELPQSLGNTYRQNPRCSEGTGNFLRQLISRFNITIDEADLLSENVIFPLSIPGRCPVILKTRLTHLANNGDSKDRIIAGLFDAIADNALALIRPGRTPVNILLAGGVCQSKRIRNKVMSFLLQQQMNLLESTGDDYLFLEAAGCAVIALENHHIKNWSTIELPFDDNIMIEKKHGLSFYLSSVNRILRENITQDYLQPAKVIIGLDIGSTGSKLVVYDYIKKKLLYDSYINTNGDPFVSTCKLIDDLKNNYKEKFSVSGFGVTGSGRDLTQALLSTCFGSEVVYVRNEIMAHVRGAQFYNTQVDTIIEIGGQDSKYIRISDGNIIDVAMNETCSAGTGSFIEEQGKLIKGINDVEQLSRIALKADSIVSLGSHCSVFMANMIDQAVSKGLDEKSIIAGIYDSVVKNFLLRVKGNREIGDLIFCQGMPFKSDALAASVAANTGKKIIIPPNPASVGALGIALIASENINLENDNSVELYKFLNHTHIRKNSFICKSNSGCKSPGNLCKIDNVKIEFNGIEKTTNWGGICSKWNNGIKNLPNLPDYAPDAFRERELLVESIKMNLKFDAKQKTLAITDNFQLKELFPFFATFINELGFNILYEGIETEQFLGLGKNNSETLFCSPMMIYIGIINSFLQNSPDFIFLPIMIDGQIRGNEILSKNCPVIQGSANVISPSISKTFKGKIILPIIEMGKNNLESAEFRESCENLVGQLFCESIKWEKAFQTALKVQHEFENSCRNIGLNLLRYCAKENFLPIVLLGREYSIYNKMINSGLPGILRSFGVMPVPLDCYPIDTQSDEFNNIYWNCGQKIMRAAKQIREIKGIYSILCCNYGCGPDSFIQHFVQDIMKGKPLLVIENDVRTGDSGIKTRIESFLDCINTDFKKPTCNGATYKQYLYKNCKITLDQLIKEETKVLVPFIGPCSNTFAACLRGSGINCDVLPKPDNSIVALGKKYTSGKECSPVISTIGSLISYYENHKHNNEKYVYFIPGSDGPCRFGMYNILHKIIIDRLGLQNRISILSSGTDNFIQGVPKGLFTLIYTALCTVDSMNTALHFVRPVEKIKNKSEEIFNVYSHKLLDMLESKNGLNISISEIIFEIISGSLFGCAEILKESCSEFADNKGSELMPTVSIDGALYIRCEPYSSGFIVDKLEKQGIRSIPEPFFAWLEYLDYSDYIKSSVKIEVMMNRLLKHRIKATTNSFLKKIPGCPELPFIKDEIDAVKPYLNMKLISESMLSIGSSIVQKRKGKIDASLLISPHECMQSKIVESLLYQVFEKDNLYFKAVQLTEEPLDSEVIDGFASDVKNNFHKYNK